MLSPELKIKSFQEFSSLNTFSDNYCSGVWLKSMVKNEISESFSHCYKTIEGQKII